MTTLFIAEKPSQAQDIAKVIGIKSRKDGYLELTGNKVMTWVFGHLLEQKKPDEYREEWKVWRWDTLPLVPEKWSYKVSASKAKQFRVIKDLLAKATCVVIATDAGREGELIARELLIHCGYKGAIKRLWLQSFTEADIRYALGHLLDGKDKEPLFRAALSRQRADFVYGFSLSRAASLAANTGEGFSVGRVKTPTLAMVVRRDLEIEGFKTKEYYELEATVQVKTGETFKMWHAPDEDKRIFDKRTAQQLVAQAEKASGLLRVKKDKGLRQKPPLPFTLPALQKEADKVLGFGAKKTLDVAQRLYEAKAISYPRTDAAHLPSSHKAMIPEVLKAVASVLPQHVAGLTRMGVVLRDSLFDDSKITDHYGIVPTNEVKLLSGDDLGLYRLIALRLLQALAPDMVYDQTRIELDANGVPFVANGRMIVNQGWTSLKGDGRTS